MISVTVTKVAEDHEARTQKSLAGTSNGHGESVDEFGEDDDMVAEHAGPGILILSTSGRFLYKDRRAWELCAQLKNGEPDGASAGLPEVVMAVCTEITKLLKVWTHAKDWEEYRVKRFIGGPEGGVRLSGLGLPDRYGLQEARILITIDEIGPRSQPGLVQAKELFQLTPREVNVVENLLKGWTNKEIGNALGVSEQTIKEHIKHIMAKTKTTTRTGILVRVMGL